MAEIAQIRTVQTGFPGAPGYTNWYFFGDPMSDATLNSAMTNAHAFWDSVKGNFPSSWKADIETAVSILDPATGDLLRVQDADPVAQVVGIGSGNYAGPAGACVTWSTAAVHGRKQLKGRTFLVPLSSAGFDTDGTLTSGYLTGLRAAAATLQAVANFGVWGRPRAADPTHIPPITALTGAWSAATASLVSDKVAVLKSRRD